MFFFSSFVPRSHSKASKRHLSLTWKSLFFLFSKIGIFRNSEFENRTLVSKIRVVNGNFFPKISVWKPKFVFKTRSLKYRSLFSKISVSKSGSLSKARVWKKEFDNTVVEPLYNVFENKPPHFAKPILIFENKFQFSTKQTPISMSNSDVLLKLPYLNLSPLSVAIHFVKNPAFCFHYHDRTHKNKQYDIEAWACRISQAHHTLLIFNYKLKWIIYHRYSKTNTSQLEVRVTSLPPPPQKKDNY